MFKTPKFWYRDPKTRVPWQECIASMVGGLYQCTHQFIQNRKNAFRAHMPVICIGNGVAGGSGKTPVAQALMALIHTENLCSNPGFLTRGYGGTLDLGIVDLEKHSAHDIGDEPRLLAEMGIADVIVAKDRVQGAQLAEDKGYDCLVLDDGLQNLSLAKDLNIVVIDGLSGFGNLKTLPAGPLREPLDCLFEKADAFVIVGLDQHDVRSVLPAGMPVLSAQPRLDTSSLPRGKSVYAFAGIGLPQKFYHSLRSCDVALAGTQDFADHYAYRASDIEALSDKANALGAVLATTEKDWMRLQLFADDERAGHLLQHIYVCPIKVDFNDEDQGILRELVLGVMKGNKR